MVFHFSHSPKGITVLSIVVFHGFYFANFIVMFNFIPLFQIIIYNWLFSTSNYKTSSLCRIHSIVF